MKKIIVAVVASAIMTGSAFAASHMQKVRMGTEGAYAPYNFVNDKGEIDGLSAK